MFFHDVAKVKDYHVFSGFYALHTLHVEDRLKVGLFGLAVAKSFLVESNQLSGTTYYIHKIAHMVQAKRPVE